MSTKVRGSKKSNSRAAAAKVAKTSTKTKSTAVPFQRLHVVSAVIYLLLAVAAVVFMKTTSYQLTIGYLAKDALLSTKTNSTVLGPAAHVVWNIQLRYAVAAIMVLAAVVPILYVTALKDTYRKALDSKVSFWRWLDMGIIFGLIIETVALISGLSDIPTLKIVAILIVLTSLLGWLSERQAVRSKREPAAFSFSLVTGTLPWLIIIPYALATIIYGSLVAPWWTYVLYLTTAAAAVGLTMVQYRQHLKRGQFQNYQYAEGRYLAVGMFGKIAFAVVLILGLLK